MSSYALNETTIFNALTQAVNTQVGLDLRLEDVQIPVTLMATGLAGAETISVWFSIDGGTTWEEYMQNGAQLTLTANDNIKAIYSGAYFGFTKSASASSVSLVANVREKS